MSESPIGTIDDGDRIETPSPQCMRKLYRLAKGCDVGRADGPADTERTVANLNADGVHCPQAPITNQYSRIGIDSGDQNSARIEVYANLPMI